MAVLYSTDKKYYIRLLLHKLEKDEYWLGYEIAVGKTVDGQERDCLILNEPDSLFLENQYTPEVPLLWQSFLEILSRKEFRFKPMDEGEFYLHVIEEGSSIKVTVGSEEFEYTNWAAPLHMDAEEVTFDTDPQRVRDFVEQLQQEYGQVSPAIERYQRMVYDHMELSREELLELAQEPLEELCQAADEIRRHFCGNAFDLCAVISAKGGPCSEDCKFCAQSGANPSCRDVPRFPLLSTEKLLEDAGEKERKQIMAYCLVSSGKAMEHSDVDALCESLLQLRAGTNLRLCGSLGLLDKERLEKLKAAGLDMIHNNLESSKAHFQSMCSTHTYEEKQATIRAAKQAGLLVCSGGLFGIGESMEDRIELALNERELGVDSVPVNLLDPKEGTPFEGVSTLSVDDTRRTIALLRFAMPKVWIRLAAGREYLPDKGRSCLLSGANAAISGDFLTTKSSSELGISIESDIQMIREIGYEI